MTNPNPITSTATTIAAQLGETERIPRETIWRAVRTLGPERVQAFVAQALEVEANGGILIPDGSRKRTLGGIFFYLVRTQISDDEAMQINRAWRWQQWKQRQPAKPKAPVAPAPPPLPPFVWDEAAPIIAEVIANVGEASTVKMTVITNGASWIRVTIAVFMFQMLISRGYWTRNAIAAPGFVHGAAHIALWTRHHARSIPAEHWRP